MFVILIGGVIALKYRVDYTGGSQVCTELIQLGTHCGPIPLQTEPRAKTTKRERAIDTVQACVPRP